MIYILLSLVGGIAIGYLFPIGAAGSKYIQRVTMGGLFILLAAMGAQLGTNEKVLASLDRIGFQAILLAGLSVFGSILMVLSVYKWLGAGKSGKTGERG